MDGFLYGSGLALSGAFAPAPPKGEPLAKPKTLPYCQGLSLWERWHRVAMTERASPLPLFILYITICALLEPSVRSSWAR